MEAGKHIKNKWCEMWVKGDVIEVYYYQDSIIDLEAVKKVLEDRLSISDGKEYLLFGDCRGVKYWTKEARDFQTLEENYKLVKAGSVLYTNHYIAKVILNFYLTFNKPCIPVKFCCNREEAMEFLDGYR